MKRALILLFPALLSSCSLATDPDRHTTGAPVSAENFCDEYANTVCAANIACCATPTDGCLTVVRTVCMLYGPAIQSDLTGFNPRRAGRYLADYRERASTCDPSVSEVLDIRHTMRALFDGTRAAHERCDPTGTLDVVPFASCLGDLECQLTISRTFECAEPGTQGDPCISYLSCAEGLTCLDAATGSPGHCDQPLGDGMACTDNNQCASLRCSASHGNTCQPRTVESAYCSADP